MYLEKLLTIILLFSSVSASNQELPGVLWTPSPASPSSPVTTLTPGYPAIQREKNLNSFVENAPQNHEPASMNLESNTIVIPIPQKTTQDLSDENNYLNSHLNRLKEKVIFFDEKETCYRNFQQLFYYTSFLCSGATVIISACGSSDKIDPTTSSTIATILGSLSAISLGMSQYTKKTAIQYHSAKNKINLSLGIPTNLLEPDLIVNLENSENTK